MALNFTYKKYKDVYTILNTGIVPLSYTVLRKECNSSILVKVGEIKVNETITLPFNFVDGVYQVSITDNIETEILPDILYYNNLLLSLLRNTEVSLCGCKTCNDCEDCNECEVYTNTINQVLAFAYVNYPKYTTYINTINEFMKCLYTESVLCSLTNNMVSGNEDTKKIFLQIIAMHYLAFYLVDLIQATDLAEAEYIKTKYNSTKILKCIKKLGIDIDDINELFLQDMNVFYWQLPDLFQTITDIIPIFNNNYLSDKNFSPLEEFEEGKIVPYTSIGRIAFAIQETDILNFQLLDSLGNDITDEFDAHHFAGIRTVLFVSKFPYSYSNIFFKFKKITFLP